MSHYRLISLRQADILSKVLLHTGCGIESCGAVCLDILRWAGRVKSNVTQARFSLRILNLAIKARRNGCKPGWKRAYRIGIVFEMSKAISLV